MKHKETKTIIITRKYYEVLPEKKMLTRYKKDAHGYLRGRWTGVPPYLTDGVKYIQMKKDYDYPGPGMLKKGQMIGRLKRNKSVPEKMEVKIKMKKRR